MLQEMPFKRSQKYYFLIHLNNVFKWIISILFPVLCFWFLSENSFFLGINVDKGASNRWLLNLSPFDYTVNLCKAEKTANMPHVTQGRLGKAKWIYEQVIKTQHEFLFSFRFYSNFNYSFI